MPKKQGTDPERLQKIETLFEEYMKQNPEGHIGDYLRILYGAVTNLRRCIEDPDTPGVSWENPWVELRYPVESGEAERIRIAGKITQEQADTLINTFFKNREIKILRYVTGGAVIKNKDELWVPEPEGSWNVPEALNPVSLRVKAGLTDRKGRPKKAEIDITFLFLPLVIDRDKGANYYPIIVGLDYKGYSPEKWEETDREVFWEELLENIGKRIPEETFIPPVLQGQALRPISDQPVKASMRLERAKQRGEALIRQSKRLGIKSRGEKTYRQPTLDETMLGPALYQDVQEAGITAVGLDLTEAEIRVVHAIQKLFTDTEYRGNLPGREQKEEGLPDTNPFYFSGYRPALKITPAQFLEAFGVSKYQSGRGKMEYRRTERDRALKTLRELSRKSFLIWYERITTKKGKKTKQTIQTVRRLFDLTEAFENLSWEASKSMKQGVPVSKEAGRLQGLIIEPSPILLDGITNRDTVTGEIRPSYFLLRPANLYQEIRERVPGASKHKYLYKFFDYLLVEGHERSLRRKTTEEDWTIKIRYVLLAHRLWMLPWINNRKWKSIRQSLDQCYKVAVEMGYLKEAKTGQGIGGDVDWLILNPEKYIRDPRPALGAIKEKENTEEK